MNRNSILSLLLSVAIIGVATKTYLLWREGPWEIPQPGKAGAASLLAEPKNNPPAMQLAMNTKNIIDNNLFDPERGAGRRQESQAASLAAQRIRSLVLVGTVILGESRYAILQEPSSSSASDPRAKTGGPGNLRLKLGDTVEGFKLSRIEDRKVAFSNGATNVEINIDFFRKVDGVRGLTGSPQGRLQGSPLSPRRDRLPPPPRP